MTDEFFEVASPDCVADDFDGEIVAINMQNGVYYCVRELGAAVWRDLVAGHSLKSLLAEAAKLDAGLEAPMRALLSRLVAEGLLRACPAPAAAQQAASLAGVWAAGGRSLEIENYDDMQDLVLADPIHDVDDEQGWPIRKPV